MHKHSTFNTFEEAFLQITQHIIDNPEFQTTSRIGDVHEISGLSYDVLDLKSFQFENEQIGRLGYDYAVNFYEWMISGSTDSESIVKKYPNIARFMEKPKNPDLPANFNTFYGPRILSQLPFIIEELKTFPDSRRAVISILDKDDLELLNKDESLEFPCCDSATFFIREGRLNVHVHMRSQNMGQVLKLDMYLWGRFTCELAEKLEIPVGKFSSSVVSAHVFKRDFDYLNDLPYSTMNTSKI
jgi:thymidylate synthase